MNIAISVYQLRGRPVATVRLWEMGPAGLVEHVLLEADPINAEGGERDPWVLLTALYGAIAAARRARTP